MMNRTAIVLALTMLVFPGSPGASQPDTDVKEILDIVQAVERGWEQADGSPFRKHFLDIEGARYVESGGQNEGLTDLIEHHVEPEGDAFDSFELTLAPTEVHVEGDFAWAITDVELDAVLRKDQRRIHNRGFQTLILRRVEGAWKVVHTHSSSRPVRNK
jgi:uncharacterized protein (TIGR02246 family)